MLAVIDGRDQLTPVHVTRPVPGGASGDPASDVAAVVRDVRRRGDEALVDYTKRFDHVRLDPGRIRVEESVLAGGRSLAAPGGNDAPPGVGGRPPPAPARAA